MAGDLSPILRQQSDAAFNYGMDTARNAYDKSFFKRRGKRQMNDFSEGFGRQVPSFTAQQTQRGLGGGGIQSGVMQRAMRDFVGDYTRDLGRMQEDYNRGLTQFDVQQGLFDDRYRATLDDLELQKALSIASTADGLMQLKKLYGGL